MTYITRVSQIRDSCTVTIICKFYLYISQSIKDPETIYLEVHNVIRVGQIVIIQ